MNYKEFFNEIKTQQLQCVYLLHGEEEYAKQRAVEKLKATLAPDFFEFNYSILDDGDAGAIIGAAEQLPMLDERRLVLVTNSRYLTKTASEDGPSDAEPLLAYLKAPNPSTVLVFVHKGKCDSRLKLFKAIDKAGGAVPFESLAETELAPWLISFAANRGQTLGRNEAMHLINMMGRDLNRLSAELTKVCDYAHGRPITRDMLETCVVADVEHNTFRMIDEFIEGRPAAGLVMLCGIFTAEGRDAGFSMVGAIASKLRSMTLARQALDMGKNPKQAAEFVGGSPYAARRAVDAAKRFTMKQLDDATLELGEIDIRMKTTNLDAQIALERYMTTHFAQKQ